MTNPTKSEDVGVEKLSNEENVKMSYDDNVKIWKDAYTNVLKVCEKYPEFRDKYASEFSDIHKMAVSAKDHLVLIEWYEKYGLRIDHDHKPYSYNYFKLGDYTTFSHFNDAQQEKDAGEGGRYIGWPDDDRQPKNEWLFSISFSTGPYIFGEDYEGQKQLFRDFFDELKSYKPDYLDSHNNSLYWKLETAKPIYDRFATILDKYHKRNQAELKQRKADRLREELQSLENEL